MEKTTKFIKYIKEEFKKQNLELEDWNEFEHDIVPNNIVLYIRNKTNNNIAEVWIEYMNEKKIEIIFENPAVEKDKVINKKLLANLIKSFKNNIDGAQQGNNKHRKKQIQHKTKNKIKVKF